MPKLYQCKFRDAQRTQDEVARRDHLRHLVACYEAVRFQPGPERNVAKHLLGEALRLGGPFRDGRSIWQWSKAEGSIIRHNATLTNHPHGAHKKGD